MSTSIPAPETLTPATIVHGEPPVFEIKASSGRIPLRLGDLWTYRELLYFLVWRDVKIRYKQTALGAAWALLQPLANMLVFSLFFGKLGKIPSDGIPYHLFCLAGLVPWTFFVNGLTLASNSLVGNAGLIRKVYFPRLIIPISTVLSGLVDLSISFGLVLVMMLYYRVVPTWHILFLPVFILLACITSLGVGLWFSSWNVQYRDVQYIIPFIGQFWMFATPVAYPASMLKEPWHTLYGLNPMSGVIEGFRWALFGTHTQAGSIVYASAAAAVLLLFASAHYFRRVEISFADQI